MPLRLSRHLKASKPQPVNMPENPTSSSFNSNPTNELLHQTPFVKLFPGEDCSFSAFTFLTQCEDAMIHVRTHACGGRAK